MLKKILIGIGILIGLVILAIAFGVYYFSPREDKILNFINANPKRSALLLIRNDTIIASQNMNKIMPLASTVKIILAIEYAEQSTNGLINPDELIPLDELDRFYVPNTDGGAHPGWLKSVNNKISENQISIREIAKGMIKFSSNANTEWLLNKLGCDKVNSRLDSLAIGSHTEIYDIVSALFVGKELFPDLKGKVLRKRLDQLGTEEYIEATGKIHQKLFSDTLYKKEIGDLSLDIQKVWSDRLPSSTVEDYVSIMKRLTVELILVRMLKNI